MLTLPAATSWSFLPSVFQSGAAVALAGHSGALSAGGMTCLILGCLAIALVSYSAVIGTVNSAARLRYQYFLIGVMTMMGLLALTIMAAVAGISPRWTVGVAFAGWMTVSVPALVWFNGTMRAHTLR